MNRSTLGVLGGMGPLSSAEFMCTLYECALEGGAEQDLPAALLLSDPSLPDRTRSLLSGDHGELRDGIERGLQRLVEWGCQDLIMCCFTAHQLVPELSPAIRARLLSLLDITLDELKTVPQRCVVLCSSATRKLGLLEKHPDWAAVQDRCVFPDDADQELVNGMIFRVKSYGASTEMAATLDRIVTRYDAQHCIFGCSELHMLNRLIEKQQMPVSYQRLDPLYTVARKAWSRATGRPHGS